MDLKDFNFIVDLVNKNSLCVANVKQLDTNVVFNITVTNRGEAVNLTGMTLTLFIRKPDGKLVFQDKNITIVDAVAGKIKIAMKASALQAMGTAVANLDFKQGEQYSTSSNFFFHVGERIGSDDAVESEVDVPLFWELDAYIQTAIEQIEKYKALFEAFVEAGVSLEGLNDIKQYIDDNLAELKFETDEAVDLIAELKKAIANGETKRTEIVSATNKAESKRVEVVNATNTANTAKTNLETATTNANNKKTQVETATASAEAKRVELVSATNTANTSKANLETATNNANTKKGEVETATANAEKKRVEVVNATNTANTAKTGLDSSISSGSTLKTGLDASITSGTSAKTALETATTNANTKKNEVVTATTNAESKRAELVTVTNNAETKRTQLVSATTNAEAKRVEVVNVTNNAEAKRKELQDVIDSVGEADLVTTGQMNTALEKKLDKTGGTVTGNLSTSGKINFTGSTGSIQHGGKDVLQATSYYTVIGSNHSNGMILLRPLDVTDATNQVSITKDGMYSSHAYPYNVFAPSSANSWARGLMIHNATNTKKLFGLGFHGNQENLTSFYVGKGEEPWRDTLLAVTDSTIKYKSNIIYHSGNKPTPSDIGASPASHTHSYLPLGGGKLVSTSANPLILERTGNDANLVLNFKTPKHDKYLGIANGVLKFGDSADVGGTGHVIYHSGNKPTPADIGALGATAKAESAKTADKLGAMSFAWSYGTGTCTHLWGSNGSSTEMKVWDPKNITVGTATNATNASKLNNKAESSAGTANTIVSRDGAGDVVARLLRTTYADQTTMGGAIAFRTNNSTDNYTRYCSNPTAVRNWLGALATSGGTINNTVAPQLTVKNSGGTDAAIVLDRNTNANWKILNNSGTFKLQCDYTTSKGSYYDAMRLDYNTGAVWFKGCGYSQKGEADIYHLPNNMKLYVEWFEVPKNSTRKITLPTGLFKSRVIPPMTGSYVTAGNWETYSTSNETAVTHWDLSTVTLANYNSTKPARIILWVLGE